MDLEQTPFSSSKFFLFLVIIDPHDGSIWMYVMSRVHLSGQRLCQAKTLTLDSTRFSQHFFFYTCHTSVIVTIDVYHFIPLSLTLNLLEGPQGRRRARLLSFFFSYTFHLIRMEYGVVQAEPHHIPSRSEGK